MKFWSLDVSFHLFLLAELVKFVTCVKDCSTVHSSRLGIDVWSGLDLTHLSSFFFNSFLDDLRHILSTLIVLMVDECVKVRVIFGRVCSNQCRVLIGERPF